MNPTRHYLNRSRPTSLLDLLVEHYDELDRLIALTDGASDSEKRARKTVRLTSPPDREPLLLRDTDANRRSLAIHPSLQPARRNQS